MQQLLHPSFKLFNPFTTAGRLPEPRIIETHKRLRGAHKGKRPCHYSVLYLWPACLPFCFRLNIFLIQENHKSFADQFLFPSNISNFLSSIGNALDRTSLNHQTILFYNQQHTEFSTERNVDEIICFIGRIIDWYIKYLVPAPDSANLPTRFVWYSL